MRRAQTDHRHVSTSLGTMALMTWKTEKSLLSTPVDVRNVDNYWDLLPIEVRTMIVNMLKRQDETTTKTYWKVCFRQVLGHLISHMHCKHCGQAKVPTMSYYDYAFGSSCSVICPSSYHHLVYVYGRSVKSLTEEYWRGNPKIWKGLRSQDEAWREGSSCVFYVERL